MKRQYLVIGVGNPDRGDDAAGLLAARKVRGLPTTEVGDCARLIDAWSGVEQVVVIDAMVSGEPPGAVRRFDAGMEALPIKAFPSTHAFGLGEAIELARALGRLPGRLTVFGIEAGSFTPGAPVSDGVNRAVDEVVGRVEAELS